MRIYSGTHRYGPDSISRPLVTSVLWPLPSSLITMIFVRVSPSTHTKSDLTARVRGAFFPSVCQYHSQRSRWQGCHNQVHPRTHEASAALPPIPRHTFGRANGPVPDEVLDKQRTVDAGVKRNGYDHGSRYGTIPRRRPAISNARPDRHSRCPAFQHHPAITAKTRMERALTSIRSTASSVE